MFTRALGFTHVSQYPAKRLKSLLLLAKAVRPIASMSSSALLTTKITGTVYEKRLIESYISENGRDPVNGEELTRDDLIDLKTARSVKPRPPALTSIPSLLSTFQNEWDALALESFTLKQHLARLRQELSTALYNNDAAVRVIARLTKERDEARDALSKVSLQDRRSNGANGVHADGDAMQVDSQGLPSDAAEKVDATKDRLVGFYAGSLGTTLMLCTDSRRRDGNDPFLAVGSVATMYRLLKPPLRRAYSHRKVEQWRLTLLEKWLHSEVRMARTLRTLSLANKSFRPCQAMALLFTILSSAEMRAPLLLLPQVKLH